MNKITPEESWIVGDYLRGYDPDHIAHLYGWPLESVERIITNGMEQRRELQANTKPYVAPIVKTKPGTRMPGARTPWQTATALARWSGLDVEFIRNQWQSEEGRALGIERREPRDTRSGYLFRMKRCHCPKHDSVQMGEHRVRVHDGLYVSQDVTMALGYTRKTASTMLARHIDAAHKPHLAVECTDGSTRLMRHITLDGLEQWLWSMGPTTKPGRREALDQFIRQERRKR